MRRLTLTTEDVTDILGGGTINAMIEDGEEVALSAPNAPALVDLLVGEQERRCAYNTREGDGRTCDCKYQNPLRPNMSEATGCPELRSAIWVLGGVK